MEENFSWGSLTHICFLPLDSGGTDAALRTSIAPYVVLLNALTFCSFKSHSNTMVTPSPSPFPQNDRPTVAGGGTATTISVGYGQGMFGKRCTKPS